MIIKFEHQKNKDDFSTSKLNELIYYITGINNNYNFPEKFIQKTIKSGIDELKKYNKFYNFIDFIDNIYIKFYSSKEDECYHCEKNYEIYYEKFNKSCAILERVAELTIILEFYNFIIEIYNKNNSIIENLRDKNFVDNIKNNNINFYDTVENVYEIISEIINNQLIILKNKDNTIYDYFLENLILKIDNKYIEFLHEKSLENFFNALKLDYNYNIFKILEIKTNFLKKIIKFKEILTLSKEGENK